MPDTISTAWKFAERFGWQPFAIVGLMAFIAFDLHIEVGRMVVMESQIIAKLDSVATELSDHDRGSEDARRILRIICYALTDDDPACAGSGSGD